MYLLRAVLSPARNPRVRKIRCQVTPTRSAKLPHKLAKKRTEKLPPTRRCWIATMRNRRWRWHRRPNLRASKRTSSPRSCASQSLSRHAKAEETPSPTNARRRARKSTHQTNQRTQRKKTQAHHQPTNASNHHPSEPKQRPKQRTKTRARTKTAMRPQKTPHPKKNPATTTPPPRASPTPQQRAARKTR